MLWSLKPRLDSNCLKDETAWGGGRENKRLSLYTQYVGYMYIFSAVQISELKRNSLLLHLCKQILPPLLSALLCPLDVHRLLKKEVLIFLIIIIKGVNIFVNMYFVFYICNQFRSICQDLFTLGHKSFFFSVNVKKKATLNLVWFNVVRKIKLQNVQRG